MNQIPNISSCCTDCIHKTVAKARPVQRQRNVKRFSFWFVFLLPSKRKMNYFTILFTHFYIIQTTARHQNVNIELRQRMRHFKRCVFRSVYNGHILARLQIMQVSNF